MEIIITHTGPITVNTYILHNDKNAAIIDPGGNEKRLLQMLQQQNLTLTHILLTHGHFDHIGAMLPLKKATGAVIEVSVHDERMLYDNKASMGQHFGMEYPPCHADVTFDGGDVIDLGFARLSVIATPGHTNGSVTFAAPDVLFTGDTLFYDSIGRSDFPGGDYELLLSSIKEKLFIFSDDTTVYPGHGQATTIGREKQCNPFLGFGWNK